MSETTQETTSDTVPKAAFDDAVATRDKAKARNRELEAAAQQYEGKLAAAKAETANEWRAKYAEKELELRTVTETLQTTLRTGRRKDFVTGLVSKLSVDAGVLELVVDAGRVPVPDEVTSAAVDAAAKQIAESFPDLIKPTNKERPAGRPGLRPELKPPSSELERVQALAVRLSKGSKKQ